MGLEKLTRLLKIDLQTSRYSVKGDSFYAALLDNIIPGFQFYTEKRRMITLLRQQLADRVTIDLLVSQDGQTLRRHYQNHILMYHAEDIFNTDVIDNTTQLEWVKNVILSDNISPSENEIGVIAQILANYGTEIFGQLIVKFRTPIYRSPSNINLIIVGVKARSPTFGKPYLGLLDNVPISLVGYDDDTTFGGKIYYGLKWGHAWGSAPSPKTPSQWSSPKTPSSKAQRSSPKTPSLKEDNVIRGIWDRNLTITKTLVEIYENATKSEQTVILNLHEKNDDSSVYTQYDSQGNQIQTLPFFNKNTHADIDKKKGDNKNTNTEGYVGGGKGSPPSALGRGFWGRSPIPNVRQNRRSKLVKMYSMLRKEVAELDQRVANLNERLTYIESMLRESTL